MFNQQIKRTFMHAALDSIFWLLPPTIFLYFYTKHSAISLAAIPSHLWLALLIFSIFSSMRVAAALFFPRKILPRIVCITLIAALGFLTVLYYSLVLIGLNAWGQVISWDLLSSYAKQSPALADALGISFTLSLVALVFLFGLFVTFTWWYLQRVDWPSRLVNAIPRKTLILSIVGTTAIAGLELFGIFHFPARESTEPIITTFFPNDGIKAFGGQARDVRGTEALDKIEDAVRAAYVPNPNADKKNLILIVVDALRPDHLGLYGYSRNTTPNLGRLAKSNNLRLAQGMRASCAESACGLFSLASSKYFHEVSARPFTLQQVLKTHGYQVHLILGGDHTNFYGLRGLYGNVDSYVDGSDPTAQYMNSDRWVLSKAAQLSDWSGTPTMFQFHLMSAHPLGTREPEFMKWTPVTNYSISFTRATLKQENAINYYDNGVLQMDDVIEKLLETLRVKGYLKNTLVVITADHGEALGEHNEYSHAKGLREAMIRIPMAMFSFGYTPQKLALSQTVTSQVDISPTVLHEFQMPRPQNWRGIALQENTQSRLIYLQQGSTIGLIDFRSSASIWKYWLETRSGEEFAFNLTADFSEKNNAINDLQQRNSLVVNDWRLKVRSMRPVAAAR
jgi:glucan phosphoethanolaminetransferase (alkaline phosphatase superfamily)